MAFDEDALHDGRFLHNHVGRALSPELFDPASVKGADASRGNWMLRRGNLKKFANGLRLYIEGFLGAENNYQAEDFLAEIDLTCIAKDEPPCNDGGDVELAKLCQLALAAAVHSPEDREHHVQTIMGLEEHVQEELMHLIGDVANIFATGESEGEMAAGSDGGRMSGTGSEGGIPSPISSPRCLQTRQSRIRGLLTEPTRHR